MKKLLATVGVVGLMAGMTLAIAPAGANVREGGNGVEPPWPTLRVQKTYPAGRAAPPGTVFTIEVECDSINDNDVSAESVDASLTFVATNPQSPNAAPDTTDNDDWVKNGNYWELTSKWLKNRTCEVIETDVTPVPINLTTLYRCDFSSTLVELVQEWVPVDQTDSNGYSPGCVNPDNGETTDDPPAVVQFTAPWDFVWVKSGAEGTEVDAQGTKTCDAGPPVEAVEDSVEVLSSKQLCQQVGTITVINDDPGNPGWEIVAATACSATSPCFTG